MTEQANGCSWPDCDLDMTKHDACCPSCIFSEGVAEMVDAQVAPDIAGSSPASPTTLIALDEYRVICRLAWNGWEDNETTRKIIAEQEAKDPYSAASWNRVVLALIGAMS